MNSTTRFIKDGLTHFLTTQDPKDGESLAEESESIGLLGQSMTFLLGFIQLPP